MERGTSSSKNTAQPACAACKYQRRKCGPSCILAPFFPHYRQREFLNCHKLFGVRKIAKMIEPLDPSQRHIAIDSIIFEADMRAQDPVGGCVRLVQNLQYEIVSAQTQLGLLHQHLAAFRAQASHSNVTAPPPPPPSSSGLYLQEIPPQQLLQQQEPPQDSLQLQPQEQPKGPQEQPQDPSFNYNSLQEYMGNLDTDDKSG